jgi:hypothetical protein
MEADKAIDGDSGTRWSSAFADNQWWQVDLGSAQQVDTVKLSWEDAYATRYQILTSTDGTNFTQAADVTNSAPGQKTTTFPARSARYVRVMGLTRGTPYGFSFWGADVYGPNSTAPTPPPTAPPPPPTTPPPAGTCRTPDPGTTSDFLAPQTGSRIIWRDDCSLQDPLPLYGAFVGGRVDDAHNKFTNSYNQIASGRLTRQSTGGPSDLPNRHITVNPADQNWGIRDALGYNWNNASDAGWGIPGPGPTVLWHEGEYRELTTWIQLGQINNSGYFRQLLEIKQSEPYTENPARGAMFELQQREGNWMAICQWSDTWTIPVTQSPGTWVPVSVEGLFSADASQGWIRFKIGDQTSPIFHRQTLLRDTSTGASVPSFMELGPYQDPALPQFTLGFSDVRVYG